MSTTEQLMVVAPVEPVQVGEQFEKTPPHLTVFPWFKLQNASWADFSDYVEEVIEETRAPLVIGGSSVSFGPNEDIHARRLDVASPTFNILQGFDIHAGIYRAVHMYGEDIDDTYTGLNWKPHISATEAFILTSEQQLQLTTLAIMKKTEQRTKLVKAVFAWGNHG